MAWKCSCGHDAGDYDVFCTNCGARRPRSAVDAQTIPQRHTGTGTTQSSSTKKMMDRYADGYRVARAMVGIGGVLKSVGIIGAVLVFLIGLALWSR